MRGAAPGRRNHDDFFTVGEHEHSPKSSNCFGEEGMVRAFLITTRVPPSCLMDAEVVVSPETT